MKQIKVLICILFLSLWTFPGLATDTRIGQDRDVMEKAKGKKYRNGAEEGELRVQAQLYRPQRKISPVIDKKEAEHGEDRD